MTTPNLNWIANYIWGIADDVLRDIYVRAPYSDDADHRFRQADHRFRSMPITLEERRSIAALGSRVTELKYRGWSGCSSTVMGPSQVCCGDSRGPVFWRGKR